MNRGHAVMALLVLALAWVGTPATPLLAQGGGGPPGPSRDEALRAARVVMDAARYATLVTLDAAGQPQARIVDPFPLEPDLTVWVATNARSRKVAQVAADPRVTLLYFDATAQSYVTLVGTARLVRDPAEKAKRFKDEWAGFYADRNRGDDYLLIAITPGRLEILAPALGFANDPETWRPVTITLR